MSQGVAICQGATKAVRDFEDADPFSTAILFCSQAKIAFQKCP